MAEQWSRLLEHQDAWPVVRMKVWMKKMASLFLAECEYPDAYLCLGRITDLSLEMADRVEPRLYVALAVE